MGRGPCSASPQRLSLAGSSRAPWGNWHLWFGRLWERVCRMAQLGTLDYGRKLSHPEVGRDKEALGPASQSTDSKAEVLGRSCLWATEVRALSSTGTVPEIRGPVTLDLSHKASDPPGGSLCILEAKESRIPWLGTGHPCPEPLGGMILFACGPKTLSWFQICHRLAV